MEDIWLRSQSGDSASASSDGELPELAVAHRAGAGRACKTRCVMPRVTVESQRSGPGLTATNNEAHANISQPP